MINECSRYSKTTSLKVADESSSTRSDLVGTRKRPYKISDLFPTQPSPHTPTTKRHLNLDGGEE